MRAMVLCAGYGTRLGELTEETPKPMLPLAGKPMLAYIIRHLVDHGFDEITINLHFMPEIIPEYFGDGSRFGARLTYSEEPALLGTAGGVRKMGDFLRQSTPFLVQYGDVITDQDFTSMVEFHRAHRARATLLLHRRPNSNSIVELGQNGQVMAFTERPSEDRVRRNAWVNSGVYLFDPGVLSGIPGDKPSDFPRDVFPRLVAEGQTFGFPLSGYRCALDSPERVAEAQAAIGAGRMRIPTSLTSTCASAGAL